MKRDSLTVWIESPNAVTLVPWDTVSQSPIWYGITEPTLSVLKAAWERDKGNIVIIPDPVPVPPEPRNIDMRRLRKALNQLGILAAVNTALASIGGDAEIDWNYATEIKEDYPLVLQLATALNLDIATIFDLALELT